MGTPTYQTIVVGTDGSQTAARALETAFELARAWDAELHVVTAYRPLTDREVYERQRGLTPKAEEQVDEAVEARDLLGRVARSAAEKGVRIRVHADLGSAGEILVGVAAETGADLIIVGNRGMSGLRRVLGSVPNYVTHHAPCSVLVVRTEGPEGRGG